MTLYLLSSGNTQKNVLSRMWDGIKAVFRPSVYAADKNQETQFCLEISRQAQNEKLHNERQALQKADLQLRAWQHESIVYQLKK